MQQSKKQSLTEAISNTAVGMVISYAMSFVIYPILGWEIDPIGYAWATLFFTVLSIARNYFVRRGFNWVCHA